MEFYSAFSKRPIRLSDKTRKFAYDSLNYKYGLDTKKLGSVVMDDIEGFDSLSDIEKYDLIIKRIACESPIRICDGEKVSGAATLGLAISHVVPATFNGNPVFSSISHLTVDFETVLKRGINSITEDILSSLEKCTDDDGRIFLNSALHSIESMKIWHQRYVDALKIQNGYESNVKNLMRVPFSSATSFYEAVQSLWFTFAFLRLCGNWPGIGRIDYLLGDFLKHDLSLGILTLDEAREILAHFFIKGCEWICGGDYISGDAQHYQNIVLAGIDENSIEVTNEVTYLVLDIIEELGISDFPTTVRINKNTDEKLLSRVADVIAYGGGVIAIYNEDLVIDSLVNYGYPIHSARKFANDGCWEVQIPGETFFTYYPFDALAILQKDTLNSYKDIYFSSFEDLYSAFICNLKDFVTHVKDTQRASKVFPKSNGEKWKWRKDIPCTVVSIFEKGCIEKARSYLEGGPIYNVVSPHIGGLCDVANSLYAIKKLVFDDCIVTFSELMKTLESNWENNEPLRRKAEKYLYFGNDNDEVDYITARVLEDFADICDYDRSAYPYLMPAGVSTFGRQIQWAPTRLATAYGKQANTVLSPNFSPTPGTDVNGATAIIKSYCKSDLARAVSGSALDVKILSSTANSENGNRVIEPLIKSFVSLGGYFMQLDIADKQTLIDAQNNPENYRSMSVRVSGWNARFISLSKEWQDMVIEQF